MSDKVLRAFLEKNAAESKESISLESLDNLVKKDLHMDMSNREARSRMQSLFVSYHALLRRHGADWVVNDVPKVAVRHVLSAVKPRSLYDRLDSDIQFAYNDLRKDFKGFMKHAMDLSDAFQKLDVGPRREDKSKKVRSPGSGPGWTQTPPSSPSAKPKSNRSKGANDRTPLCLYSPCKEKAYRHYLKNCPNCPVDEEARLFEELAREKAKDGPARSTRFQKAKQTEKVKTEKIFGTAGRLGSQQVKSSESASCPITVFDGQVSVSISGRCDDGSDDSIVSARVAEQAAIKGIGKISTIEPVRLQVALKTGKNDKAQTFRFSRSGMVPRTVLHLSAGQLALINVSFLIADDDLTCEDLLIGLPVLRHLQVDTKTLL